MDSEKRWYGVQTFNGYEQKVIDSLKKQIESENMGSLITDIYLPVQTKYSFVRSKLKAKEELLFPGYIFVEMKMTNETLFFVRGVQYVIGYAGIASMKEVPNAMEEGEIDQVKEQAQKVEIDLEPGNFITIVNHNTLENQKATISEIWPEREKMLVRIEALIGDAFTEETLDFSQIEKY